MNYVGLIGRLTKDPEVKTTSGGKKYVRFTLAVTRTKEITDFINCVAWEKTAELLGNYARKGKRIGVQGSINVSQYKGQNDETRYSTDVRVDRVELLDSNTSQNSEYTDGGNFTSSKNVSSPFMQDSSEFEDDNDFPF